MLFRLLSPLIPLDDFVNRRTALDQFANTDAKKRIEAIYAVLTVLDSKASALMRLDGVMLAAGLFGISANLYRAKSWEFGIIALSSVVSMMLCLAVVAVDWKFLEYVTGRAPLYNFEREIESLRKVRWLRELCYRWAWFFAVVASWGFLIVLIRLLCR
jgi:hypothetical protein